MNHHHILPIIKRLEEYEISYALGGSGMMNYFNLVQSVNDWDITVACPKDILLQAISGITWIEGKSGDYPFASEFRISIPLMNIDIIGHFALYTDEGVFKLPISSVSNWNGIRISCPEVWYVVYSLLKREEKARIIMNYLTQNKKELNREIIYEMIESKVINKQIQEDLMQLIQ